MKSLISAIFLIFLGIASPAMANELKDFTSDGCSKSPDGIPWYNPDAFLDCCIQHDIVYWHGGTADDRILADQDLKACIDKTGHPDIAKTYYYAVRVGGSPKFNSNFRWGYGWKENRGYTPLTQEEWDQVEIKLQTVLTRGITIQ
ncbi:helicase [Bdellovibrio sp. HCB290]|uniref:helicase n=1 Tax=Bdellovibrio sp. HCB290 TaxID=3394356 RepID=UPI0039B6C4C7